jgi:CRP/FNR family transcriptional regulator
MSKKLLHAQMKIKTLALSDTFSRTAQILIRLSQQYGRPVAGGIQIDVDMTRQDLANLVGTTRETVSRVLSSMKKDKVLDFSDQQIIILDVKRLDRYKEV